MIAAGYEDGNDATSLRVYPLFKLALERAPSAPDTEAERPAFTLSR